MSIGDAILEVLTGTRGLKVLVTGLIKHVTEGFTDVRARLERLGRLPFDVDELRSGQVLILDALARVESEAAELKRLSLLILEAATLPAPAFSIVFSYVLEDGTKVGHGMLKLTAGMAALFSVTVLDRFQNPAQIEGPAKPTTADPTIIGFENLAADGLSGTIRSLGPWTDPAVLPDGVQIGLDADADLGEGVKPITGTDFVKIDPAEAATFKFNFQEPFTPAS